jgi:hypothetical protein
MSAGRNMLPIGEQFPEPHMHDAWADECTRAARAAADDELDLPELQALEADMHAWRERVLRRITFAAGAAAALLLVGVAWWSRYAP